MHIIISYGLFADPDTEFIYCQHRNTMRSGMPGMALW